jgi:hypothetical protein
MRVSKRAAFAIAFVSATDMAGPGLTQTVVSALPSIMKPLQGVSLDIGTNRAVSYFLGEGNACKLTLTLAEVAHDDEVSGLTATRMTVAIESGRAAQFDTAEGKSLEFECQAGAMMRIKVSDHAYLQRSE